MSAACALDFKAEINNMRVSAEIVILCFWMCIFCVANPGVTVFVLVSTTVSAVPTRATSVIQMCFSVGGNSRGGRSGKMLMQTVGENQWQGQMGAGEGETDKGLERKGDRHAHKDRVRVQSHQHSVPAWYRTCLFLESRFI